VTTRIGIDIGGTFTDAASVGADGVIRIGKQLTSVAEEHRGAVQAARDTGLDTSPDAVLAHGTTLVINALLERHVSRVALVTTKGFADTHELAVDSRPEPYCLNYRRDPVLVPRELRFEIDERLAANGEVLRRPSEQDIQSLVDVIRDAEPSAIAVAFINSYVDASNERLVGDALKAAFPNVPVTLSSDISQNPREYQRFTTAAANASVAPLMRAYLGKLNDAVRDAGFSGDLVVLDSNGGAQSLDVAMEFPIRTIESGPVAGALASLNLAVAHGIDHAVTFDMGGTTAKSCLIERGSFLSTDLYWIGGYSRGFPTQIPCIDIIEVGAGGGSIAWLEDGSRLRVGPRSAGSSPGPACYRRGGTEPTVTDANLFCGRLPAAEISGDLSLDREAAEEALQQLASRLGLEPLRLSLGILQIAVLSMAGAVRRQTLELGYDPRDFWLIASGGAGPMHACDVAREVGIRHVAVPLHPGHLSAIGMLSADLRFEGTRAINQLLSELPPQALLEAMDEIRTELMSALSGVGASDSDVEFHYSLLIRYVGQEHTLKISAPVEGISVPENFTEKFTEAFVAEYKRRFGHANPLAEAEVVHLELVGRRSLPRPKFQAGEYEAKIPHSTELAYFGLDETPVETSILDRRSLSPGDRIAGPTIVCEEGSTFVMPPGTEAVVLDDLTLLATVD